MAKKKKEEDINNDEESGIEEEDDFSNDDLYTDKTDDNDDNNNWDNEPANITNSLELAHETIKPSDVAKQFKEMPKEVKIAFLTDKQANDILHYAKTYRNYQYIKKNFELQKLEDDVHTNNRKLLYSVKTVEDLKAYFVGNNKTYLYNILQELNYIDPLLKYVRTLKPLGLDDDIENLNKNLDEVFTSYNEKHHKEDYIDDLGLQGNIISTATVSSGLKGNERYAGITAISANKDINVLKDAEEKPNNFYNKVKKAFNKLG